MRKVPNLHCVVAFSSSSNHQFLALSAMERPNALLTDCKASQLAALSALRLFNLNGPLSILPDQVQVLRFTDTFDHITN